MCCTLNPLNQLHKKWISRYVLKHRWYTTHWTVQATPLSIWTTEAPSKMTTLTPSAKSFTGEPNASKPVSSFTTKTMRHIRHLPPPPPQKKNVTLSYPHKNTGVDQLMFGMVRFQEVRQLKYTDTVHWQFWDSPSTDSDMRSVSSSIAEYICLPPCLFVYLWVCLFAYQKSILPLASDLNYLRHCLGLKHNFFRDVPKSKQSKLVNTKKICGGDFRPPW